MQQSLATPATTTSQNVVITLENAADRQLLKGMISSYFGTANAEGQAKLAALEAKIDEVPAGTV